MSASMLLQRRFRRNAGISMIETLLVLFLIAIVISLLLPAFSSTRFNTRIMLCQNNMREIGRGFMDFAQANKQRLPGNTDTIRPQDDPRRASWLFCSVGQNPAYATAPQSGTLYEFTRHKKLYRCPSLEVGEIKQGKGSNGMFDYGMLNALYGARIDTLPLTAYFHYPTENVKNKPISKNKFQVLLTPILMEEDPSCNVNLNNIEADFSNYDQVANTHRRVGIGLPGAAANYVASDCSVQTIYRDGFQQQANHIWAFNARFNAACYLGWYGPSYIGQWDDGVRANALAALGDVSPKPADATGIPYRGMRVAKGDLPSSVPQAWGY